MNVFRNYINSANGHVIFAKPSLERRADAVLFDRDPSCAMEPFEGNLRARPQLLKALLQRWLTFDNR